MDVVEARTPPLETTSTFAVRALLLAEPLDTRGLERDDTIATMPLTLRVGRSRGIDTLLDLVQNQRSMRLEWYIIGLIALELLLSIGSLLLRFPPA